jgi:endo-1,4-beta-xylanase
MFVLTVGLGLLGCSGSDAGGPGPIGGDQGVGGSTSVGGSSGTNGGANAVGGFTQTAGATNTGGIATGGSKAAVGGNNPGTGGANGVGGTGGNFATGGSNSAVGGNPSTGGLPATGGSKTGGGATGGLLATGGMAAVGGTKATGGMAPTTGGMPTTGGAKATGGSPATGGGSSITPGKKFCGNITTGYSGAVDTGGMKYSHYWDQVTPENAGKWGSVQSSASSAFNWATLDAIYSYTNTNNIAFKQHTFVWGSQQPSGTPTLAQVENWIKSFCQRYPNTKLIDVVNEPPPHTTPNYTANLGAGETGTYGWITKAFKLAKQYCGSAILILNDYNNAEYTDQRNHFVDIVTQIKAGGAPIDAVGCQGHDFADVSTATVQANLAYLNAQTGLPIYITEYDVSRTDDTQQLNIYKDQFPFFWSTSYIHGITIWGWIYGSTWSQAPDSGLVRGTAPRSAMTWLMGQLGRPVPPN